MKAIILSVLIATVAIILSSCQGSEIDQEASKVKDYNNTQYLQTKKSADTLSTALSSDPDHDENQVADPPVRDGSQWKTVR